MYDYFIFAGVLFFAKDVISRTMALLSTKLLKKLYPALEIDMLTRRVRPSFHLLSAIGTLFWMYFRILFAYSLADAAFLVTNANHPSLWIFSLYAILISFVDGGIKFNNASNLSCIWYFIVKLFTLVSIPAFIFSSNRFSWQIFAPAILLNDFTYSFTIANPISWLRSLAATLMCVQFIGKFLRIKNKRKLYRKEQNNDM